MEEVVTLEELKKATGKRVEVIAFGIAYVGKLEKIDTKNGVVRIRDKEDCAVLEIERIESFRQMS